MGLLDDAIREHLELKRRRGADPGEVAREQREALEPALDAEGAARELDLLPGLEDLEPAESDRTAPVAASAYRAPDWSSEPAPAVEPAAGGQETAELDMKTVLERHEDEPFEHLAPGAPDLDGPGEHQGETSE